MKEGKAIEKPQGQRFSLIHHPRNFHFVPAFMEIRCEWRRHQVAHESERDERSCAKPQRTTERKEPEGAHARVSLACQLGNLLATSFICRLRRPVLRKSSLRCLRLMSTSRRRDSSRSLGALFFSSFFFLHILAAGSETDPSVIVAVMIGLARMLFPRSGTHVRYKTRNRFRTEANEHQSWRSGRGWWRKSCFIEELLIL